MSKALFLLAGSLLLLCLPSSLCAQRVRLTPVTNDSLPTSYDVRFGQRRQRPAPRSFSTGPKAKPDYSGSWQLTASFNFLWTGKYWSRDSREYKRDGTGGRNRQFLLPDGQFVNGSFLTYSNDAYTNFVATYPQVGLLRQFSWGGAVRAGIGYYRSELSYKPGRNPLDDLREDYILTVATAREASATFDLGFQYTFRRRRRFRPYLGIGLNTFLYSYGRVQTDVYDGQTGQSNVVGGFEAREYLPMYTDIKLTAGFQYDVAPNLSLGFSTFANGAADILLDAPLGVEARYRLGSGRRE